MPAVNFTVQWPDGSLFNAYSPSTVIYDYLEAGQAYPLSQFMQLAEQGLNAASERVRTVYGYACSSAMDNLLQLKARAKQFPDQASSIHVLSMSE